MKNISRSWERKRRATAKYLMAIEENKNMKNGDIYLNIINLLSSQIKMNLLTPTRGRGSYSAVPVSILATLQFFYVNNFFVLKHGNSDNKKTQNWNKRQQNENDGSSKFKNINENRLNYYFDNKNKESSKKLEIISFFNGIYAAWGEKNRNKNKTWKVEHSETLWK